MSTRRSSRCTRLKQTRCNSDTPRSARWCDPPTMQTSKPTRPASPEAIRAADAAPKKKQTNYPEPFASRVAGREKRPLGDVFGLSNFGVNLTRLAPGAISALRHAHTRLVAFAYLLAGHPTPATASGDTPLAPGT